MSSLFLDNSLLPAAWFIKAKHSHSRTQRYKKHLTYLFCRIWTKNSRKTCKNFVLSIPGRRKPCRDAAASTANGTLAVAVPLPFPVTLPAAPLKSVPLPSGTFESIPVWD
jgi:hypothetical protein